MSESSSAPALLRTALFDEHVSAGARIVDFAGWEMPVQYQGIIAEHNIVRTGVGLFDLSHMGRLRFRGPDALEFIQTLTTNDVSKLQSGRAQYSLCCADDGGVLDDVVVYRLDDEILMVVNASNREKILSRIEELSQRRAWTFSLEDQTLQTVMIGVQGPQAQEYLQPMVDVDMDSIRYYAGVDGKVETTAAFIARTGYTGEDGFELILAADAGPMIWQRLQLEANGIRPVPCGLGARDTLRLEAGMALYGHELDEQTNPYQAGLGRVVKLDKGDFAGQPALRKLAEQGPDRRLVGFELTGQGVPRQGYEVKRGGSTIGVVTSGTMSPTLHKPLGMAYVSPDAAEPGTEIEIQIRQQSIPAVTVAVPFYQHRTKRSTAKS